MIQENFVELNEQGYTIVRNLIDKDWLNKLLRKLNR
jgi:hypothetical protein